ncbi:MAG: hypothetical protein KZQ81_11210 [Candidatus Thiodiazotropha sp. (ex Rostrolucina anterorostrata)]|nr:hypothetical protein [Candidatus Thiodiazotropha sp. (ex Rostrolucina anterorostrata)]
MHRLRLIPWYPMIWLIPLLFFTLSSSFAATSPSRIMSKAMIAMMDTMGDLAQQFKGDGNWGFGSNASPSNSWNGFNSTPWGVPGSPYPMSPIPGMGLPGQYPYLPPGAGGFPMQGSNPFSSAPIHPAVPKSIVDGIWIGQAGEIVLVMYGHFRIYASAEVYRDGRYRIQGNKLIMFDPETETTLEYDYALDSGRMIMRSESGTLLLFKQLPIPIPPYLLTPSDKSPE